VGDSDGLLFLLFGWTLGWGLWSDLVVPGLGGDNLLDGDALCEALEWISSLQLLELDGSVLI